VSRVLSCEKTAGMDSMVTYGIALEMEYNFFRTEMGAKHFAFQLRQIHNASIETACLGVATAIYTAEVPGNQERELLKMGMGMDEFLQVLRREVAMWNIFTKSENGYKIAIDMTKELMTQRGVKPSMVIMPDGAAKYIQVERETQCLRERERERGAALERESVC